MQTPVLLRFIEHRSCAKMAQLSWNEVNNTNGRAAWGHRAAGCKELGQILSAATPAHNRGNMKNSSLYIDFMIKKLNK